MDFSFNSRLRARILQGFIGKLILSIILADKCAFLLNIFLIYV